MKNTLFAILIVSLFSCKKENKTQATKIKQVQILDTVYCDNKPITTKKKLSMYNSHYTSIINKYPLKDQKIIVVKDESIEVCYQNEIDIILLKKNDTVYNIKVNMDTIFNNISPYNKNIFKEELKNLKLESIITNFPRAQYLYYSWNFTEHTTKKEYRSTVVFDYLSKTKGKVRPYNFSHLINSYLKDQTQQQINQKFGEPITQETFIMSGSLTEFRGNLKNYISKEEYTKDSISIKEVTWRVNKDDNVTIWYQQKENNWKAIDAYNWDKNSKF